MVICCVSTRSGWHTGPVSPCTQGQFRQWQTPDVWSSRLSAITSSPTVISPCASSKRWDMWCAKWYGGSQIDTVRNRLASEALAEGFEELMWIDADIAFHPASVERLRAHGLPIVCGLYPTKVECRPTWIIR